MRSPLPFYLSPYVFLYRLSGRKQIALSDRTNQRRKVHALTYYALLIGPLGFSHYMFSLVSSHRACKNARISEPINTASSTISIVLKVFFFCMMLPRSIFDELIRYSFSVPTAPVQSHRHAQAESDEPPNHEMQPPSVDRSARRKTAPHAPPVARLHQSTAGASTNHR